MNQHCGELVSLSEAYLASVLLSESGAQNLNEQLMVSQLFVHPLIFLCLSCWMIYR